MIKITYDGHTITVYRPWWKRLANSPFEMGLALFAIYSGITGLMNFGASNEIFSEAVVGAGIFNWIFIGAGAATIAGSCGRWRGVEGFGLISIIGALLTRMVVILLSTGWNVTSHNLLATCIIYIIASGIRLMVLPNPEHYFIK